MKVFIVDDKELFRNAIIDILKSLDGIEVIGEAENGAVLLEKLKSKLPDVILMDLEMPVMNGIEATKQVCEKYRGVKVVAVSFHDDMENMLEMIHAGARNYILKDEITVELLQTRLNELANEI